MDIEYHRTKMEKRELDKKFKNSKNLLRVVFVCAMWLTGLNVKCLSCLYLDKPLKGYTLMQIIARANRVSEGKSNGLIVDYIGIVKALRKALANYTANVGGDGGTDPTVDKDKLIARILETIGKAKAFLEENDFDLQTLNDAQDFTKLSYLQETANAVCSTIEDKKAFTTHASELNRLMKYTIATILIVTSAKSMKHCCHLCEAAKETEAYQHNRFDISAIDLICFVGSFPESRRSLVMKDLEELIQQKLARMLFTNPERINYYEWYQQIINDYNGEQDRATIEKTFTDLMDMANKMKQEEQWHVCEGFASNEELSLYDMLFRDELSKNDIKKLKEVAAIPFQRIKKKFLSLTIEPIGSKPRLLWIN